MGCLSLGFLRDLFIWVIVIGAIIAIIKLLLPMVFAQFGGGGVLAQIINIVLWAFVAIVVVMIAFTLISCLLGSGGGGLSFPRPR